MACVGNKSWRWLVSTCKGGVGELNQDFVNYISGPSTSDPFINKLHS